MRMNKKMSRTNCSCFLFPSSKKGISVIVGYVLLVSMTLALSVLVFNWLKFYVQPSEIDECSDDVNIIINGYECYQSRISGRDGNFSVTLKNKGLFTVDGYSLKFHTEDYAEFGFYIFNSTGSKLKPGESVTSEYNFSDYIGPGEEFLDKNAFHTVSLIEIQPFMNDDEGNMSCQSYTIQKITCIP